MSDLITKAPPRQPGKRATEQECQATIVAAAHLFHYRVLAIRPAANQRGRWQSPIQGDAGFPDLVLTHPRAGVIFAELKRWPNKVEPDQAAWREAIDTAGGEWRLVWVPEGQDDFLAELQQRARP